MLLKNKPQYRKLIGKTFVSKYRISTRTGVHNRCNVCSKQIVVNSQCIKLTYLYNVPYQFVYKIPNFRTFWNNGYIEKTRFAHLWCFSQRSDRG